MSDEFPKDQWPTLLQTMQAGGPDAVVTFVRGHDDPVDRRKLYSFCISAFGQRDWEKDMDALLVVANAAIDDALEEAAEEPDAERAAKRTDFANVIAWNMGANLADCWGDETVKLERRHFETGLALSARCLAWREELGKGAFPFSLAWWLRGIHLISLNRPGDAVDAFSHGLRFARDHATERDMNPEDDTGVHLHAGYLGIAEHLSGVENGNSRYDTAQNALAGIARDEKRKGDADFCTSQLTTVWTKYVENA